MVVRSYHVTLHQTALFSQNTGREGLSAELSQDHPRLNLIQKHRAKTFVVFLPLKVYKLCHCLWHKKQSLLFKELLVKAVKYYLVFLFLSHARIFSFLLKTALGVCGWTVKFMCPVSVPAFLSRAYCRSYSETVVLLIWLPKDWTVCSQANLLWL